MGRHQCDIGTKASASCRHRTVFGDLVPIEQYRNGSDGRHRRQLILNTTKITDGAIEVTETVTHTDQLKYYVNTDRIMVYCPSCGAMTRLYAKNCDHCGYRPTTSETEQ